MRLADWLAREKKARKLRQSTFAKEADLDPSTITKLINGERRPDWVTLEKISRATNGEVTPNDFRPPEDVDVAKSEAAE